MDAAPAAAIAVTVLILIALVIWGRRRSTAIGVEQDRYRTVQIDLDAAAGHLPAPVEPAEPEGNEPDTVDLREEPSQRRGGSPKRSDGRDHDR